MRNKIRRFPLLLEFGVILIGILPFRVWGLDGVVCNSVSIPASTPSSEFLEIGDGEIVRHLRTGLEWQRCSVGQVWDGADCTGNAALFTWQESLLFAEQTEGWRLPNINELASIVEECRERPSINEQVFPSTPYSTDRFPPFWSSTPMMQFFNSAWTIGFEGGNETTSSTLTNELGAIRLVRDEK